jgi:chromosomal replication initiation ATPase DnaA
MKIIQIQTQWQLMQHLTIAMMTKITLEDTMRLKKIIAEVIEIDVICSRVGVSYEELLSKNRKREFVNLRIALAVRFRKRGIVLSKIGILLNRDHTTIIYYLKTFEGMEKAGELPNHLKCIADGTKLQADLQQASGEIS